MVTALWCCCRRGEKKVAAGALKPHELVREAMQLAAK